MQWILGNWMLLLVGGGMVAMHLFGHGHKDRGRASELDTTKRAEAPRLGAAVPARVGTNG